MKRGKKTKANEARDLSFFISDRMELARRVFLALKPSEVKAMAPKFAKDLPMDDIKALCLEELINMSTKSLRAILGAPEQDTVVLDSDSDAEESSAASSNTETSDSDSNDSDGSDSTSATSDVSDDVMVIDDSDVDDTKADIDNKQQLLGEGKNISRSNKADAENNNACNSESDLRDKYLDRINKLDILTAKLGQEIDKLSKKKKSHSQNSIGDYVNEMVSELTKIDSEISTEHNMVKRKESVERRDTDLTEETVEKSSNIHHSKRKTKRKAAIEDIEVTSNNKISKVAENSVNDRQKLKNKPKKQCNGVRTQPEAVKNQRESKKTLEGATVTTAKIVNRLTDNDKRNEPTEDVEATVCLLSDSDDSQDEIESELQHSIAETRKHQVLGKETLVKPNYMVKQSTNKASLEKSKKPFSEDDIEIEIVVDGGPNLDNRKKSVTECARGANAKGKGKDRNKNASKPSSETLVSDMTQKLGSTNSEQLQKDSTDQVTLLSSDSDDSDNNTSAPEDGEIDSLSDESEGSKVNNVSKRRKRKTRLVRITSKESGEDKLDIVETISITTNSNGNVPTERNNDDKRPQLRSSIIRVTEDDKLTETNINKVKSVAVKMPQAKENYAKPEEIDHITVVVKNASENEATNIDRIVKMTEDIKSVESVVVTVRNQDLIADDRSHLPFDKHDTNKNTKTKVVLRPEEPKFVAKASDFVFVKPKHCRRPILMARETSDSTKFTTPIETNPSFTLDENDMDVLDINLQDDICLDTIEQDAVGGYEDKEKPISHGESLLIGTKSFSNFLIKSANNNDETSTDNRNLSYGEVQLTETIEKLIDVIDPTIGSKDNIDTLKKKMTQTDIVSDSVEKVLKVTDCDETVMPYTIKNNQVSNSDALVNKNTKQIDGDRNLTFINNCTVEDTLVKNATVDVEEIVQYSFENNSEPVKFEPMMTDAENEERVEITTKVEKKDNIVNIESTNDYSQQSITPCTEAILRDSENQTLVKANVEKVLAMSRLDTAYTSAVTEASTLDQANQSLEEGELDSTVERCSPHPAILLEDGGIYAETELPWRAVEEGELTDPSSSDVESIEIPKEIICISDEEPGQDTCGVELPAKKLKKKKKTKEKIQKNEEKRHKKCKGKWKQKAQDKKIEPIMTDVKQLDGEGNSNVKDSVTINNVASDTMVDLNMTREVKIGVVSIETSVKHAEASKDKISKADDIKFGEEVERTSDSSKTSNEIKDSSQKVIDMLSIEISSDDSSDELVFENLDELTAAIDGIESQQVEEHQAGLVDDEEEVENISWRDRYLDSKKVKKVLTTSNILNALRKKNKELKKKLLESNQADNTQEVTPEPAPVALQADIEEGSIEHYNTLQSLTKFVDPVLHPADQTDAQTNAEDVDNEKAVLQTNTDSLEGNVTKEMRKNAKNLLKMYKKLLKYNDMNRASKTNKKAKKKKRKKDETG